MRGGAEIIFFRSRCGNSPNLASVTQKTKTSITSLSRRKNIEKKKMEFDDFERVLSNGMWQKLPSLVDPKSADYDFQVGELTTITYFVNRKTRQVVAKSFPKDLPFFRPGILSWEEAWETWFAPWCTDPKLVEFCTLLEKSNMDWTCNTQTLEIKAYQSTPHLYEIDVQLDGNGKVATASFTRTNINQPPDPFYNPPDTFEGIETVIECLEIFIEETKTYYQ